jgi:8-oxo-dGTP pyrophosphatase MutT (NUDIX family)
VPPTLHAAATTLLERWEAPDAEQESTRRALLAHLRAHPDAMWRSCPTGHLTGSALVVDATWTHGLLVLHRRLGRWLQTGGHCDEGDETLAATAWREATEETGIDGLRLASPDPVDLDVHALDCPAGHPNRHLDVRWLVVAPAGATAVASDESDAVRWVPLDALAAGTAGIDTDESVRRLARLARRGHP